MVREWSKDLYQKKASIQIHVVKQREVETPIIYKFKFMS